MDEMILITQYKLAEKYDVPQATVSQALTMANVSPVSWTKNGKRATGLYDERSAVEAILKLYERRKDGHFQAAEEWQTKIDHIKNTWCES